MFSPPDLPFGNSLPRSDICKFLTFEKQMYIPVQLAVYIVYIHAVVDEDKLIVHNLPLWVSGKPKEC